jgi:hypothetical protein
MTTAYVEVCRLAFADAQRRGDELVMADVLHDLEQYGEVKLAQELGATVPVEPAAIRDAVLVGCGNLGQVAEYLDVALDELDGPVTAMLASGALAYVPGCAVPHDERCEVEAR